LKADRSVPSTDPEDEPDVADVLPAAGAGEGAGAGAGAGAGDAGGIETAPEVVVAVPVVPSLR